MTTPGNDFDRKGLPDDLVGDVFPQLAQTMHTTNQAENVHLTLKHL